MSTATVHITELSAPTALFCRYPDQPNPQPCHLALDLRDGKLSCDYNPELDNRSIPQEVRRRLILWFPLPCLTATAANDLMIEVAPLAQTILDGATITCDDNPLGVLTAEAQAAEDTLTEMCAAPDHDDESRLVVECSAHEWFDTADELAIAGYRITADSTDAALQAAADRETVTAQRFGVVLAGALEWFTDQRETLRRLLRDDLEAIAADLASLTTRTTELTRRRNVLIRQQIGWDTESSRTVATIANLSHTQVLNIVGR